MPGEVDAPHVPVLAGPAIEWLAVRPEGTYVDCTAGAGGHAALIARRLHGGRLIAMDRDPHAAALARRRLETFECVTVVRANYAELRAILDGLGVGRVDGILIDCGVSSMQIDTPERGFSWSRTAPLDMRMDPTGGTTAAAYLRRVSIEDLVRDLKEFGDVRPARRIARAILRRRDAGAMETTDDLAAAVREALPFAGPEPEELRTVFQSVRIRVNEELRWIEAGLAQAIDALRPGGRVCVIAFHSGEDRVVKTLMRDAAREQRLLYPDGRVRDRIPPRLRLLTRAPVRPDDEEVRNNPRAKSARLRVGERL
ncbi:MAG TPA: 16S rRNA (cytosine(1402)-N(4))-methyltransferase RsmH [Candidatus Hydrogenedentes bacterium]|nr:16S rRNA (cytosine(1402)-N(4))-methyltransferase RsmH [Candidatus Hydrogenedentota bacterium]HNT88191.1 16S rRNA (cytosine(1402)-N(4))-methyltransferase RsmH [Candidatus Hydrogenedentota bacterium]